MNHTSPIGILDSGIGGLSIWREITRVLPQESAIYIGDHAYQPYGNLSVTTIQHRVKQLIGFLLKKKTKIIVVACNTATVAGIDRYRRWFPSIPIIGVVPVVKVAVAMTKTKHIAVISTPYTAASRYQKQLIKTFSRGCNVENIGVPELVPLIEEGGSDGKMSVLLRQFLRSKIMNGVDVIALGCTHYPFIRHMIAEIVGNDVAIIDSGGAVARHVGRVLSAKKLHSGSAPAYTVFYTTGDRAHVSHVATTLMGARVRFEYARV